MAKWNEVYFNKGKRRHMVLSFGILCGIASGTARYITGKTTKEIKELPCCEKCWARLQDYL